MVSIAIYQEEARDATEPPTRHRTIPRATDDGLLNIKGLKKKTLLRSLAYGTITKA